MNNKRTKNSIHAINLLTKTKTHKRTKTLTARQEANFPKLQHLKSELPLHIPSGNPMLKTTYFKLSGSRNNTDRDYLESVDVEEVLKCSLIPTSSSTAFIKKIRLDSKTEVTQVASMNTSFAETSPKENKYPENFRSDTNKKPVLMRFKRRKLGMLKNLPTHR